MVAMDTAVLNGAPKGNKWMKKADLYIVRTDGLSCTRETVEATGCLTFAYPSTQQHLLVWKTRPKCAMVLKKLGSELGNEFRKTVTLLQNQGLKVVVEPHEHEAWGDLAESGAITTFSEDELTMLHQSVDFVVCLGGDGVILHASYLFASAIPPVISFNLGSMGFLTNHSYKNFESDIMGVIEGVQDLGHCSMDQEMYGVHITLRMRLMCQIHRCDGQKGEEIEVLNEVVVDRGANPYLTKIECWEHDRLITKVQADGVMLATPTGSTAYSVAAGGSMVHPNVPAILFTPICPHSLSFRPVILPDYAQLDLRIPENSRGTAWVCFDGKRRQELQPGDYVNVRMSQNPVPTINKTDQTNDWFTSLERCFGWNERVEQGAATPPPKQ
ncbi:hypothetical protein WJX84_010809 [Apatococcus fuscideae]|uniref:NAD(+) kinase n=1 Tax=Apatococcus fuscideae TaxID=2026836 RepID=A0AAW1SKJ4_9CHLO